MAQMAVLHLISKYHFSLFFMSVFPAEPSRILAPKTMLLILPDLVEWQAAAEVILAGERQSDLCGRKPLRNLLKQKKLKLPEEKIQQSSDGVICLLSA